MGTLCTSPTQYSETRNQLRDLSGAPRSCLFTTRPTVRFPALRGLPGGVGMSVSTGLIGPVRHAVGERPLFAHSGRLESTLSGRCELWPVYPDDAGGSGARLRRAQFSEGTCESLELLRRG